MSPPTDYSGASSRSTSPNGDGKDPLPAATTTPNPKRRLQAQPVNITYGPPIKEEPRRKEAEGGKIW